MLTHEAVLAIARVAPDQLLDYLKAVSSCLSARSFAYVHVLPPDQLYAVSEQFYDIPSSEFTPVQLREKLVEIATPIIGQEKVASAKDVG